MDVQGLDVQATGVGECLQSLDQTPDPIGLVHDQLRESGVFQTRPGLQKLGRPSNARERILDFVRQRTPKVGSGLKRAGGRILVTFRKGMQRHDHRAIGRDGCGCVDYQRRASRHHQFKVSLAPVAATANRPLHEGDQRRTRRIQAHGARSPI